MSATWTIVLVVGVGTIAIKALGPILLGGRPLPPRAEPHDHPPRPRPAGRVSSPSTRWEAIANS